MYEYLKQSCSFLDFSNFTYQKYSIDDSEASEYPIAATHRPTCNRECIEHYSNNNEELWTDFCEQEGAYQGTNDYADVHRSLYQSQFLLRESQILNDSLTCNWENTIVNVHHHVTEQNRRIKELSNSWIESIKIIQVAVWIRWRSLYIFDLKLILFLD